MGEVLLMGVLLGRGRGIGGLGDELGGGGGRRWVARRSGTAFSHLLSSAAPPPAEFLNGSRVPGPGPRLPARGCGGRGRWGPDIQSIKVEPPPGVRPGPSPRTEQSTFSIMARDIFLAASPGFMSTASLMATFNARAAIPPNFGRHEAPRPPHKA